MLNWLFIRVEMIVKVIIVISVGRIMVVVRWFRKWVGIIVLWFSCVKVRLVSRV